MMAWMFLLSGKYAWEDWVLVVVAAQHAVPWYWAVALNPELEDLLLGRSED